MKFRVTATALLLLTGCNRQAATTQALQVQLDSLKTKLDNSYKPGLGEFMSSIQVHHAKLWFAGTNNNWKLADFEIHEIREALDAIQQYNTDRPEAKAIAMITPAIDSVSNAVKKQNQHQFNSSYTLLTNTCNSCHQVTEHGFNVVTVPSIPPVSNQRFTPVH